MTAPEPSVSRDSVDEALDEAIGLQGESLARAWREVERVEPHVRDFVENFTSECDEAVRDVARRAAILVLHARSVEAAWRDQAPPALVAKRALAEAYERARDLVSRPSGAAGGGADDPFGAQSSREPELVRGIVAVIGEGGLGLDLDESTEGYLFVVAHAVAEAATGAIGPPPSPLQ